MENELCNMRREMDELRNAVKDRVVENLEGIIWRTDSPFTTEVLNTPVPPKFCLPQLESFNGSRDPLNHIESFNTLMLSQISLEEVMRRAFLTMLKGAVRVWFSKLPSGTIVNFEQLSKGSLEGNDIRSQLSIFSTSAKQRENCWDNIWRASIKSYF